MVLIWPRQAWLQKHWGPQFEFKTRDIVLDPFGGSGTTIIACEKSGRRARLMELDPKYVDVIIRRFQDYTGKQATRQSDGMAFDALMSKPGLPNQDEPIVSVAHETQPLALTAALGGDPDGVVAGDPNFTARSEGADALVKCGGHLVVLKQPILP